MYGHKIVTKPVRRADLAWDELYDEISHDWRQKAADLQARRWLRLRQQQQWRRYKDNEFLKVRKVKPTQRSAL